MPHMLRLYPWIGLMSTEVRHFFCMSRESVVNFMLFVVFWRVDQYPAILWKTDPVVNSSLEFTRWITVASGLVFFALFGFADEAQKHYKLAFTSVVKRLQISTSAAKVASISSSSGYVFTQSCPQ